MKVAIFIDAYHPYINGVITHVDVLKDGLIKKGHEVLIVTADPKVKEHTLKDGILRCPAKSIKKFYNYGVTIPVSKKRLDFLEKFNPDVIHVHTEFSMGLCGVSTARRLKVPLVYTLHTMYDDYLYYITGKTLTPILKKPLRMFIKHFLKPAKEITGPSAKCQVFIDSCGSDKKVHVINNPVEFSIFNDYSLTPEETAYYKKKCGIKNDSLVATFVGRLGHEKSVDTLIKFYNEQNLKDRNIELLIVGDGPAREGWMKMTEELSLGEYIHFPGKILHAEVMPYYAISDCYITTSLSDTNSISMLEAMAMGLPTFHIEDPLNKGQVVDGYNGFVFKDGEELKNAFVKYIEMSDDERKTIKNNAIDSVRNSNDTALAEKLLAVYESAILKNSEDIKCEADE